MLNNCFKNFLNWILRPHGRFSFIKQLKKNAQLLDVGCGSLVNRIKEMRPDIIYTGMDICKSENNADFFIISTPENFAEDICKKSYYDAITSNHNLEHCNERENVIKGMITALKTGGKLFLAFPTEDSTNFPSRCGTLNYYDDDSHIDSPPSYDRVVELLKQNNMDIIFSRIKYKPLLLSIIGFFEEEKSKKLKKNLSCTWDYWGFETIIWAKKK